MNVIDSNTAVLYKAAAIRILSSSHSDKKKDKSLLLLLYMCESLFRWIQDLSAVSSTRSSTFYPRYHAYAKLVLSFSENVLSYGSGCTSIVTNIYFSFNTKQCVAFDTNSTKRHTVFKSFVITRISFRIILFNGDDEKMYVRNRYLRYCL